jgi:hypothetical protein
MGIKSWGDDDADVVGKVMGVTSTCMETICNATVVLMFLAMNHVMEDASYHGCITPVQRQLASTQRIDIMAKQLKREVKVTIPFTYCLVSIEVQPQMIPWFGLQLR